jgi:N-acetylmuramic acid 6-phosphate etherase
MNLTKMTTEQSNPKTAELDAMSLAKALSVMNYEDQQVALSIQPTLPTIQKVIEHVIASFQQGGRLLYVGAGTSGRIGLMDAVECPPTFGTPFSQVQGIMAGGDGAFVKAKEGAEDDEIEGKEDLVKIQVSAKDVVIGIAASGRTPYVIGAMNHAKSVGAKVFAIANNTHSAIGSIADIAIEVECGPEVLTGSTRLKAGTSQKMICNMISTLSMVGIGKVYKNFMVDVQQSNKKLEERAIGIIQNATGVERATASKALAASNNTPKVAIVMILADCGAEEAHTRLTKANGFVRQAMLR